MPICSLKLKSKSKFQIYSLAHWKECQKKDFTRAEFGDFGKVYTETAYHGVVSFFDRNCSVSSRTESTSAHSRPPTGSRYHLKHFNFVLSGQLSMRRWSQYILFSSSSQNKKSYVDFGSILKKTYFFPNSAIQHFPTSDHDSNPIQMKLLGPNQLHPITKPISPKWLCTLLACLSPRVFRLWWNLAA